MKLAIKRHSPGSPGRLFGKCRSSHLAAATVLVALVACTPASSQPSSSSSCAAEVALAAQVADVDVQIAHLDAALVICRTFSELAIELSRYPGILGTTAENFVALRCSHVTDSGIIGSPSCISIGPPATTQPSQPADERVFVGETLDGRTVTIRPDADTEFVGDVPTAVQAMLDIIPEEGCVGLAALRDIWAARIGEHGISDEASAYAKHAGDILSYIGCAG